MRSFYFWICAFVFFSGISQKTLAQDYGFINYNIEEGLAQSQVKSIFQDHKGYLWFGTTSGGVSRFDGIKFENFTTDNNLLHNQISCITEDSTGNLWLGTIGGVIKYDGTNFTNYPLPKNLSKSQVNEIVITRDGTLWAGIVRTGLAYLNNGKFEVISEDQGLPSKILRCISLDPNTDEILVGTAAGLFRFKDNKFSLYNSHEDVKNYIYHVGFSQKNELCFTTRKNGFFILRDNKFDNYNAENGFNSLGADNFIVDKKGNFWITSKNGLWKFDGKEFTRFYEGNGLLQNDINTVFQDNEENIWIGTDGSGVLRFTTEAFVTFKKEHGIIGNLVTSITQDKKGALWFGTYDKGICKYDGKKFTPVSQGISHPTIWSALSDSKGNLWFGSAYGLNKVSNGNITVYDPDNSNIAGNKILALCESKDGKIWIGTNNSVSILENGKFINILSVKGKKVKYVRSIIEDDSGNICIGSSKGLIHINGNDTSLLDKSIGIPSNAIYCIERDSKGIWIGTNQGLAFKTKNSIIRVKLGEGFPSNKINFLKKDDKENLWIGTNNGIFKLSLLQFHSSKEISFVHFNRTEGIPSLETNQNAAFLDDKNEMWFGTGAGLLNYRPKKLETTLESYKPKVHITDIRLYLENTDWSEFSDKLYGQNGLPINLRVPYNKKHLTFDFIGLSMSNPEELKYQYIMEGEDENWLSSPFNFATYSNLSPGSYTFKVEAVDRDGQKSQVSSISFVILPPFYLTWWFFGTIVIVLGTGLLQVISWRRKIRLRNQETERLEMKSKMLSLEQQSLNASMNRHFIFNALNSIQFYINKQDKISANKYLTSFAKLVRMNLDSSQKDTTTLSEELERLKLYLVLEHMRFQDKFEYDIKVDSSIDAESVNIPSMLLQPYIENSIWHGVLPKKSPGKINVNISKDKGSLKLVVQDDGIGIETSLKRKRGLDDTHISQGMSITNGRINLLRKMTNKDIYVHGPLELKDEQNNVLGTKVEISLPLENFD